MGNEVTISLVPFPDQEFSGKVVSIDPAQVIVDGVVYYKVTIAFDNLTVQVKPGMTADVTIKVASRENVLTMPGSAITRQGGDKATVQVMDGNTSTEKEIQIGLQGSNDTVEVISGLSEGQTVLLK